MRSAPTVVAAWRALSLAGDAIGDQLDERLIREAGCTLLEHDLLSWLDSAPGRRVQMLTLADLLGVTRGGLTRIVDRLVDRGWVDRDRPAANRREVHAVLTAQGRQALRRARDSYRRQLDQALGRHLDATELAELTRLTDKLVTALRGPGCPGRAQRR